MRKQQRQQKQFPDSEPLVTLYEKTGNRMYYQHYWQGFTDKRRCLR
jgi:hypothetical protein